MWLRHPECPCLRLPREALPKASSTLGRKEAAWEGLVLVQRRALGGSTW